MGLNQFLGDNWPILLVPLLGLIGVYALLPQPQRRIPYLAGAAAAGLALLLLGGVLLASGPIEGPEQAIEVVLFYTFSAVSLGAGGLLITQQNPARAALSFALVILATTGLFLLLAGPFLMAASIIVYAGAIIVTFLFVLMLAQQQGVSSADARSREPFLASLTGFLLLAALLYVLKLSFPQGEHRRLLDRTQQQLTALQKARRDSNTTTENLTELVKNLRGLHTDYSEWATKNHPQRSATEDEGLRHSPLHSSLFNLNSKLPPDDWFAGRKPEDVQRRLDDIELVLREIPEAALYLTGGIRRPRLDNQKPALSELSGPAPSRARSELRTSEAGWPHLPAENTAYLGRSLFSDYLLPVELAGTLLLVAAIGAIAIAHRRDDDVVPGSGTTTGRTA